MILGFFGADVIKLVGRRAVELLAAAGDLQRVSSLAIRFEKFLPDPSGANKLARLGDNNGPTED